MSNHVCSFISNIMNGIIAVAAAAAVLFAMKDKKC